MFVLGNVVRSKQAPAAASRTGIGLWQNRLDTCKHINITRIWEKNKFDMDHITLLDIICVFLLLQSVIKFTWREYMYLIKYEDFTVRRFVATNIVT